MLYLGIDPSKTYAHCALVGVADQHTRPWIELAEAVPLWTPTGWLRLLELAQRAVAIGSEDQWCAEDDTRKWSGIAPLLQTNGAVRIAAMVSGRELEIMEPGQWRARAIAPRPFSNREIARKSERACWSALFPTARLTPDTGAAALIALAVARVNVHTWLT